MAVEEVWRRADGFRGLGIIFVRFSCLFSSERTKLHWLIFFLSWARQDPWQPAACMWARTVLTAESNIVEDLDLLWAQAGATLSMGHVDRHATSPVLRGPS
jgi:hypothetical protein